MQQRAVHLNTTSNTKRPIIAKVQTIKYPVAAWGWATAGLIAVTCSYLQRRTNVSVFWEVLCAAMCSVVPGTSLHWLSTNSIFKSPAHLTKGLQPLSSPRNLKKWQFSISGKFIVSPVCATSTPNKLPMQLGNSLCKQNRFYLLSDKSFQRQPGLSRSQAARITEHALPLHILSQVFQHWVSTSGRDALRDKAKSQKGCHVIFISAMSNWQ